MKKQRVLRPELELVEHTLTNRLTQIEEKTTTSISQLWANQNALKTGLDMAELHLRAYRRLLADVVNQLNDDGPVAMIEVEVGPEGQQTKKKVVNMRFYLEAAQAEIAQLEAREKAAQAAAQEMKRLRALIVGRLGETKTLEELEQILAQLEGGATEIQVTGQETATITDQSRPIGIELLQDVIRLKKASPVKEPATPEDSIPEGAAIFGGENATSNSRNEGPKEPQLSDTDSSGEHGASSELSQSPVPDL